MSLKPIDEKRQKKGDLMVSIRSPSKYNLNFYNYLLISF